ncbi:MAG: SpoIIE family protein phosphatase [Azospirillum sp.]|nr:SpoIIE family protein phosphatase [Azospirillum sp.]
MLLRTRVTVFVLAAFAVFAGVIALGVQRYVTLLDTRLEKAAASGLVALWSEIASSGLDLLSREARRAGADPALAAGLTERDRDRLGALGNRISAALATAATGVGATRVDILQNDGGLLYTSSQSVFPEPMLPVATIESELGPKGLAGVGYIRDFGLAMVVATQVTDAAGRSIGTVILASALDDALQRIAVNTGTTVVVVNRRGRAIAGTDPELWAQFDATVRHGSISRGDKVYSLVNAPIDYLTGSHAADLITIADTTAASGAESRVALWTVAGGDVVVLVILLPLFLYLRRSFQPLEAAVGVLEAISSGNTGVSMEDMAGRDEVGMIAHTVEVFRRRTLALERMTMARTRLRRRQERLIFKQMTALASTLEDDERDRVIADLEEIKASALASSSTPAATAAATAAAQDAAEAGDGIEITALALSKLTARITDQQHRLIQLISELREALKSKTALIALRKEIDIAASIQQSMLPKPMPPQPHFSVVGQMTPAKEIGGDFYDFFFVGENRLAIVVADVSGKGISAAFFMAITRTLLRALTLVASKPGEALVRLNDLLAEDNDEGMFVTLFYGVLDLTCGRLTYASAGHNAPVLRRAAGSVEFLPQTGGVALAVMEGLPYAEKSLDLGRDDLLVLYTDGVTEAQNSADELYGDPQLLDHVAAAGLLDPAEMLAGILTSVRDFEAGAPQADDITCVVLRVTG